MQIHTFREDQLSPKHREAWEHLQQSCPPCDSPYFRPEFTRAVASVRPNAEVAVLTQAGEPTGFFPFERGVAGSAHPVGNILSDFHGMVACPKAKWSARELLKASGIKAWNFHHLLAKHHSFQPYHWRVINSPYMDLSKGYDAYQRSRRQAGSQKTKQIAKKKRKLERDYGQVTLDLDCRDEAVFEQMLKWKSQQYQACGLVDLFATPWIVQLLHKIWQERSRAFRGRLFALSVQGELIAAEFAMQSHHVLHSWFPSYNRDYAKYGVGHILTLEIARAAEELGIERIDLGKGEEAYKTSLASGNTLIAEGALDLNPIRGLVKKRCHQTFHWLRTTPLRNTLRRPFRTMKRLAFATQSLFSRERNLDRESASSLKGFKTRDKFHTERA